MAEVKKFFKNIPQDSLPFFSTEVTVGQIVVAPKPGKKQKDDVRAFELYQTGSLGSAWGDFHIGRCKQFGS